MKSWLAALAWTLLLLAALPSHAAAEDPQTLVLNAAPQNAGVFATWSPIADVEYTLRYRVQGGPAWNAIHTGTRTSKAVPGLLNGLVHEFQVEARRLGILVATSRPVAATPRPRPDCAALNYYPWLPRVSFFCTKAALDAYLAQLGVSPFSLRCRQRPITEWNADAPDCIYEAPTGEQLLLLRSADALFAGASQYVSVSDVRLHAQRAVWGSPGPLAGPSSFTWTPLQTVTGAVTRHAQAYTYQIAYAGGLPSRITWFVPRAPVNGRFGIYHEGHGGPAVVIGAETIDWLLDRGWQVIAVDMPLIGMNSLDARPGLEAHGQFDSLDLGPNSPLALYLTPVRAIVDWIVQIDPSQDPELLLMGRSGGGWTAYTYGAVDPRIDIAVSVAGGRPISERLDAPWGAAELGDYEQTTPHLYNAVGHEHLMAAAGAKASMHFFNRWDGCCFRIEPESAFVQYLRGASSALGKHVRVFVDEQNGAHSIGAAGYVELDRFLAAILPRVPRPPSPPRGFRILTQ